MPFSRGVLDFCATSKEGCHQSLTIIPCRLCARRSLPLTTYTMYCTSGSISTTSSASSNPVGQLVVTSPTDVTISKPELLANPWSSNALLLLLLLLPPSSLSTAFCMTPIFRGRGPPLGSSALDSPQMSIDTTVGCSRSAK